jgi:outer membrane receptor protein involved in Fe transport
LSPGRSGGARSRTTTSRTPASSSRTRSLSDPAEFGVEATSLDVAYTYQVESGDEGDAVAGRRVLAPRNLVGIMNRRDKGLLWAGYLQDRWTPSDRLTLTPGLRVTSFDRTGSIYWEPRFSMSYRLTDRINPRGHHPGQPGILGPFGRTGHSGRLGDALYRRPEL